MLRVAVLGANGFIGSRAVEILHLSGLADVRPVVRNAARRARLSRFHLDCRIANGFDQCALAAAFEKCDIVIHAIAGDARTIHGTLKPAYKAAEKAGVSRFVYLSSASVHGQAPAAGTDETSALRGKQPIPYNVAKASAEKTLQKLRELSQVELVVLRPSIVFGPRSPWVTKFVEALLADEAYMVNEGQGLCNSAYVDNVVHAIYLAMTTAGIDGEAFLIGDQETITWADFYRPFAEAFGRDLSDIHTVGPFVSVQSFKNSLETIPSLRPIRAVSALLPRTAKRALSAALRSLKDPPPASSNWQTPRRLAPQATLEMSLLHQCGHRLPHTKAKKMLAYEPVVSFPEACRRTISWLAFAGYPVIEPWSRRTSAACRLEGTRG